MSSPVYMALPGAVGGAGASRFPARAVPAANTIASVVMILLIKFSIAQSPLLVLRLKHIRLKAEGKTYKSTSCKNKTGALI
jgi:hypothetical protein